MLCDWRIHSVFLVVQLEPATLPTDDPFYCLRSHMPPTMFVDGDTDTIKSFEVDYLLNKQTVQKARGRVVEYLICWNGYSPQ